MTHAHILDIIDNALADALACDDSWEGVDDAQASIDANISEYDALSIRPAALNCDGIYEPGFNLVLRIGDDTYSAVACDLLSPPVQGRHGDKVIRLSQFS